MGIEPRFSIAAVMLLGTFNPEELTPQWFAKHNLLPRSMTGSANVSKVDAEDGTTGFVSDWLMFTAHPEHILAGTPQAPYVRICDLVVRTFQEHLISSASISGFVIHRESLYSTESDNAFDRIVGNVVPFGEWTSSAASEHTNESPARFMVTQRHEDDVFVTLQLQRTSSPPRIKVSVTEYYNGESKSGGRDLIRALGRRFDGTVRRADALIARVIAHSSSKQD